VLIYINADRPPERLNNMKPPDQDQKPLSGLPTQPQQRAGACDQRCRQPNDSGSPMNGRANGEPYMLHVGVGMLATFYWG